MDGALPEPLPEPLPERLKVFGESDAGWCAATPPNETSDDDGRPVIRTDGFSAADPRAPSRRVYDDPEVCALREHLRERNGLPGLEILRLDLEPTLGLGHARIGLRRLRLRGLRRRLLPLRRIRIGEIIGSRSEPHVADRRRESMSA